MNWKIMIASHWKLALLLIQLGLLALMVTSGKVFAEPVDGPYGP